MFLFLPARNQYLLTRTYDLTILTNLGLKQTSNTFGHYHAIYPLPFHFDLNLYLSMQPDRGRHTHDTRLLGSNSPAPTFPCIYCPRYFHASIVPVTSIANADAPGTSEQSIDPDPDDKIPIYHHRLSPPHHTTKILVLRFPFQLAPALQRKDSTWMAMILMSALWARMSTQNAPHLGTLSPIVHLILVWTRISTRNTLRSVRVISHLRALVSIKVWKMMRTCRCRWGSLGVMLGNRMFPTPPMFHKFITLSLMVRYDAYCIIVLTLMTSCRKDL